MLTEGTIRKIGENNYQVSYGDDRGVFAEFYSDALIDNARTESEGRPIYRQVNMLRMIFPADTTKVIERIVRMEPQGNQPADPDRFPRQWAAFMAQEAQTQDGTPIEQWPPITKAQALELKGLKIYTVEQLAAVADNNLSWMGARQLRDNARAWLSEAEAGAETIKLRNEVEELRMQLQAMKNQNAGILASQPAPTVVHSEQAAAPSMEAPEIKPIVTKMRGRPRKVENGADVPATDTASGE